MLTVIPRNGTNEGGWGSLNHFMMGAGDYWIHRLSGLAQRPGSVRWNSIDYAPIVVGDLTYASSSYRTPTGEAKANWTLEGSELTYDIAVPLGSTGFVTLKADSVRESDESLKEGKNGVLSLEQGSGETRIRVASGAYQFRADISTA